jgi:PilZ domain
MPPYRHSSRLQLEIATDTRAPTPDGAETQEKRQHLRFDKAFPVRIESILFGEMSCIARNVSAGGIFVETRDPLPLRSHVRVCFLTPDETGEVVALGQVKNHYFINFNEGGNPQSVTGMAIRFSNFEEEGERHLRACLDRFRVLH